MPFKEAAVPSEGVHVPFSKAAKPSGGAYLPFNEVTMPSGHGICLLMRRPYALEESVCFLMRAAIPFGGFHLPLKLGAEQLLGRFRSYTVMGDATCVSECC